MDPSLWPFPAPDAAPGGGRAPGAPSGCGGAATAAVFWGSLGGAVPACPLPAAAPHLLRVPVRLPPAPTPTSMEGPSGTIVAFPTWTVELPKPSPASTGSPLGSLSPTVY